ncbi:MAG: DUF2330 domain-containing protein [Pseudanabaenaceae cyanobacterium bins.39]|nr:DUF2330 domain-containing protein [Pseudanabaenaceae cyanobacterium bins.39]
MRSFFAKCVIVGLSITLFFVIATPTAWAFCGFFVAKSTASLSNSASRVVIAHKGNHSVFTMQNNFEGDVREFARIVPIPVIPTRQQVRIGDNYIINRLDSFTAPRLAEYRDAPCKDEYQLYGFLLFAAACFGIILFLVITFGAKSLSGRLLHLGIIAVIVSILIAVALPSFLNQANKAGNAFKRADGQVEVTDQFAVGEYDVTLLSASESNSLVNWLQQNDYRVPTSARAMLQDYIQQGMKFFVVRVNLERFEQAALNFLSPIVIEYDSPQLMLPIRLGTLNASGSYQDVTVYILTDRNPVELVNYPTLPMPTDIISSRRYPSGQELPEFVRDHFQDFYQALFQQQYEQAGKRAGFWEYIGPISFRGKCDPCTMPIEEVAELESNLGLLGVFWLTKDSVSPVVVTRMHVRYTADKFPEDLQFREIDPDSLATKMEQWRSPMVNNVFQSRYVVRRADQSFCLAGWQYHQALGGMWDNLARLTGWSREEIAQRSRG